MPIRWDKHKCDNDRQNRNRLRTVNIEVQGTPRVPSICKMCDSCGKVNHLKAVCRSVQMQQQGQRLSRSARLMHEIQQDEKFYPLE